MNRSQKLLILCATFLILSTGAASAISSPSESDQIYGFEAQWVQQFAAGYVTTAPIIDDATLFVRTSGMWIGQDRPQVFAYELTGKELWNNTNQNATQHDMSPLKIIEAGQGQCGTWSKQLIVAWSDGLIESLEPMTGTRNWHYQSEVNVWGITGSLAQDADKLVAPTRTGIVSLCLADGTLIQNATTDLGWRNGITVTDTGYLAGDENGTLWHLSRDGNLSSHPLAIGKIRHSPLLTNGGIVIHAQGQGQSTIALLDENYSIINSHTSGSSPAMPIMVDGYLVTGDSSELRSFDCSQNCSPLSSLTFATNGEMAMGLDGQFMVPLNTAQGGWKGFTLVENGLLEHVRGFQPGFSTYTTAAPAVYSEADSDWLVLANDAGRMVVYWRGLNETNIAEEVDENLSTDNEKQNNSPIILLVIFSSFCAILFMAGKPQQGKKFSILLILIVAVITIPALSTQWSGKVDDLSASIGDEGATSGVEGEWNQSWPEQWQDTQILIIEIDGQQQIMGGYSGYDNVLQLTTQAASDLNITISSQQSEIGTYITSFNGHQGQGWEFFVNGSRGSLAAENVAIEENTIVHWLPA